MRHKYKKILLNFKNSDADNFQKQVKHLIITIKILGNSQLTKEIGVSIVQE
jgi:hypothetical protein